MNKSRLIIFDLDGTLFQTDSVDIEAFNRALALNGCPPKSDTEILDLIGLQLDDICKEILGTGDEYLVSKFKSDVIRLEDELIPKYGKLYPHTEDILLNLISNGHTLCICSNGNVEYVTAIARKFQFYSIFNEIWYARDGITKTEAVGILKKKFNAHSFIMVGDRISDIEAAQKNSGISIGVTYGFGKAEVCQADYIAHSILDVEEVIKKL